MEKKNSKGHIDVSNVKLHQGINWLKEILIKAKKDALNISDEDLTAGLEIIDKFKKNAEAWEIVEDNLSAKQWKLMWSQI